VVWLDGLDIPLERFFDSGFAENSTQATRDAAHPEGYNYARYGHNMAPVRHAHTSATSPIFSYPYTRSRQALTTLQGAEAPDDWHGWKLAYVNPLTGKSAIPTIATYLQLLPAGFRTKGYRTTSGTTYSVVEGGTRHRRDRAGQRHNSLLGIRSWCHRGPAWADHQIEELLLDDDLDGAQLRAEVLDMSGALARGNPAGTNAVLSQLGLSADRLAALTAKKVIKQNA
jgi:gentisate 1,2-dioxygenase